jgi:hypothetical protein
MGDMRNAYSILVGKPKGKRPLRRPRYRWENNIIMELRKGCLENWVGGCGLDASGSGQGPVAGSSENGNEPSGSMGSIKGGKFLD